MSRMRHLRQPLRSLFGAAVAVCVLLPGCSEGTVAAPQGGAIVLEASPAAIGLGGQSQITALVRDQDGNPVRGDVEVLFFTDLGSIDRAARTSSNGLATATLTAGDTPGTATVRAVAGPNEQTISVPIGTQVGGITLLADPDSIPNDTDSEIELVAVVRDGNSDPIEGAPVTFSTNDIGELESQGEPVNTDASGEAFDRLTVSSDEVEDRSTFGVFATTPGPDGTDLMVETVITIEAVAPVARFEAEPAGGNSVQFSAEDSTGQEPLTYSWDFTNDGSFDEASDPVRPLFTYPEEGTFEVRLRVSNSEGSDETTQTITVPLT